MGRRNKGYRQARALANLEQAVTTIREGSYSAIMASDHAHRLAYKRAAAAAAEGEKRLRTRERQQENKRHADAAKRLRTMIRGGKLRATREDHEMRRRLGKAGLLMPRER